MNHIYGREPDPYAPIPVHKPSNQNDTIGYRLVMEQIYQARDKLNEKLSEAYLMRDREPRAE